MKVCLSCGSMISPYPMHKEETGICEDCFKDMGIDHKNPVDNNRPKIKGKHMVIEKSPGQIEAEKRSKQRGIRVRYW